MRCHSSEPASLMPSVLPFRDIVVTIDEPGTSAAHPVSARAPAMAAVRKKRWLDDRWRATSTREGWSEATRWGSRLRSRRLVLACTRMWTSSPIWTPCPATLSTSMGPCSRSAAATTGPTAAARKRRRSTAAGVSRPNHGVSPGPWLSGAKARLPPRSLSATQTGWEGPSAVTIGTTVSWALADSKATSPLVSSRPASSVVAAQPSATTAARIERWSGSHARPRR